MPCIPTRVHNSPRRVCLGWTVSLGYGNKSVLVPNHLSSLSEASANKDVAVGVCLKGDVWSRIAVTQSLKPQTFLAETVFNHVFWSRAHRQHHVTTCLMKFADGERNVAIYRYNLRFWLCNMNIVTKYSITQTKT